MDNIAGVASFKFVEAEGVSQLPDPVLSQITTPVTLKAGYAWKTGYGAIDSLQYSEIGKKSDQGINYEAVLAGFTADSSEIVQLFSEMQGRWFLLDLTDNDNLRRLAGTLALPFLFVSEFDTQTVSGQKGHKFTFSAILKNKSPIYSI